MRTPHFYGKNRFQPFEVPMDEIKISINRTRDEVFSVLIRIDLIV